MIDKAVLLGATPLSSIAIATRCLYVHDRVYIFSFCLQILQNVKAVFDEAIKVVLQGKKKNKKAAPYYDCL